MGGGLGTNSEEHPHLRLVENKKQVKRDLRVDKNGTMWTHESNVSAKSREKRWYVMIGELTGFQIYRV